MSRTIILDFKDAEVMEDVFGGGWPGFPRNVDECGGIEAWREHALNELVEGFSAYGFDPERQVAVISEKACEMYGFSLPNRAGDPIISTGLALLPGNHVLVTDKPKPLVYRHRFYPLVKDDPIRWW